MSSVLSNGPRPLSRSLAWHRDEILAHVYDPIAPFPRFNVVGDDGSGKLELLQAVADGCAGHGLLVLHVTAPGVAYAADDSAQDRELADLYACAELIGDFVTCIERGAPIGVFLIYRSSDRRAKFGETGEASRVTLVEVFDARAFGELGVFLGDAGDILELAEK